MNANILCLKVNNQGHSSVEEDMVVPFFQIYRNYME